MKKKSISVALVTVFLITVLTQGIALASAGSSISNLVITVERATIGENSGYQISFRTNAELAGGIDMVQIRFPSEYLFSMSWMDGYASVQGVPSSGVSYSNGLLAVLIPRNMTIAAGDLVSVNLSSNIMKNPSVSGEYSFFVNTSKETVQVETPRFMISEFVTYDGVSRPHVTTTPIRGYREEEISIRFTTNRGGQLIGGVDQIILDFPSGFRLPQSIDEKTITINGNQMTGFSPVVVGSRLILPLSPTMNYLENTVVDIVIAAGAGVTVDRDIVDVRLFASTTKNPASVESFPFSMKRTPDQAYIPADDKDPSVTVSPNGAGAIGAWTFTFARNTILLTEAGTVIGFTVIFPSGTVLPSAIAAQHITINGQQCSGVLVDTIRRELIFNTPVGVGFSTDFDLTIVISAAAGIRNPPAANYLMEVTPRNSIRRMNTKSFEIKAVSDPVQTSPENPVTQGDRVVKVTLNDPVAIKDGIAMILDAPPELLNNVTMIPLRFVSEGLGAVVEYDSAQNTVTLILGSREIVLWPGSTLAKVDNVVVTLARAPYIRDGRTMVPVRFVSECFGARVDYVSQTEPITITMTADALSRMPSVAEIQAAQAGAAGSGSTGAGTGTSTGTGTGTTGNETVVGGDADSESTDGLIGKTITLQTGRNNANLRKGPGTNFDIVGLLLPTETAVIVDVNDDWYQVEFSYGLQAWIREDLVDVK